MPLLELHGLRRIDQVGLRADDRQPFARRCGRYEHGDAEDGETNKILPSQLGLDAFFSHKTTLPLSFTKEGNLGRLFPPNQLVTASNRCSKFEAGWTSIVEGGVKLE